MAASYLKGALGGGGMLKVWTPGIPQSWLSFIGLLPISPNLVTIQMAESP